MDLKFKGKEKSAAIKDMDDSVEKLPVLESNAVLIRETMGKAHEILSNSADIILFHHDDPADLLAATGVKLIANELNQKSLRMPHPGVRVRFHDHSLKIDDKAPLHLHDLL